MPVNTRRKRVAALHFGEYWAPPSLVPDGDIGEDDRGTIMWSYVPVVIGAGVIEVEVRPLVTRVGVRVSKEIALAPVGLVIRHDFDSTVALNAVMSALAIEAKGTVELDAVNQELGGFEQSVEVSAIDGKLGGPSQDVSGTATRKRQSVG